jgi:hypothetical protein
LEGTKHLDKTSGDITAGDPWEKRPRDKTSRRTKHPAGQNIRRDKTSGGPNVWRDKTFRWTKRPEGQTAVDIQIKNVRRDKTSGDTTFFCLFSLYTYILKIQ